MVSSLWTVDDEATAELMRQLYRNLWVEGKGRGDALRDAQLALLEQQRRENNGRARPFYWGAFVLDGDWR